MKVTITANGDTPRIIHCNRAAVYSREVYVHREPDGIFTDEIGVIDTTKYNIVIEEDDE